MTEEKGEKVFSGAAMSVEEKIEQEQELRRRTRRRRWMVCCCGTSLATVLVVALVCVILAVTVFKVRNPKVIVKSVSLDQFQWNMDLLGGKFDLNVTLDMSLSVKNRNRASFKYGTVLRSCSTAASIVERRRFRLGKLELTAPWK